MGKQWKQWDTLFWGGSKITANGDCGHEIKICLLLGRKAMTKLDSILKSRDITLPTKVCLVKAMVFPVVMYGCESWTIKKAEQPQWLQHSSPSCPSPTPGAYSNSWPLSQWSHPTISSSVVPFASHLQSSPASGSFQITQFFTSGGQSIGISASASVLPMNVQVWFPLGWTGWISSL